MGQQMKNQSIRLFDPVYTAANLPTLEDPESIQHLEIWFGPDVAFNSYGIRDWMKWLKPLADKEKTIIELYDCPESVIHLINMITGFIPRNAEVVSFYVSFYSEESGETQKVLFKRGHQFFEDKVVLPEVKDSQGNTMLIDVDEAKFFRFLKPTSSNKI